MKKIIITPEEFNRNSFITRNYCIFEFSFSSFSDSDKRLIINESENLANMTNDSSANEGKKRAHQVKLNDAYAGILAEFATMYFLNSLIPNSAYRPLVSQAYNQVDICWNYFWGEKSIEVRSSFVNNGIPFALYAVNHNDNKPYFDILGPYYQSTYKSSYESVKDAYSRILFNGNKYDVFNRFIKNDEKFYLIGFIDGNILTNMNYHKSLKPNSSFTKSGSLSGDYYVAPIDKITDLHKIYANVFNKLKNPFI